MVNILPDADQQLVVDSVANVLAGECPVDRLRKPRNPEDERRALQRFAQLGWFGAADGDPGPAEEMLMFREFGRYLLSPALPVQRLGAQLAAMIPDTDLTARMLSGLEPVALAHPWRMAARSSAGAALDGDLLLVDAPEAKFAVLVDEGGAILLRMGDLAAGRPLTAMDDAVVLRKQAVAGVKPLAVLEGRGAWYRLRLLLAAQMVGGAEASRDMAADYAKLRQQFGKPIGAFQAVAHHCADMAVRAEAAWCQTLVAAIVLRDGREDAPLQLAASLHVANAAAFDNATLNIRVHGGIGFTADCHAQRYLKRAVLLRELSRGASDDQTLLTH